MFSRLAPFRTAETVWVCERAAGSRLRHQVAAAAWPLLKSPTFAAFPGSSELSAAQHMQSQQCACPGVSVLPGPAAPQEP